MIIEDTWKAGRKSEKKILDSTMQVQMVRIPGRMRQFLVLPAPFLFLMA
jgi:hypothetical protein